jgi:hypothetical protein
VKAVRCRNRKHGSTEKGGHVQLALLAWTAGLLIAIACILFGIFAIYAIWWIIFRLGKEE